MSGLVFVAVLASALLHASWNAIAKAIPDRRIATGLIGVAALASGIAGATVLPAPDAGSWPFLAASSLLQAGYLLLLVAAYRHGEFSQVYPVARGLPPPVVAVVSIGLLGERLTAVELSGVILVSMALAALAFSPGAVRPAPDGSGRLPKGLGLAAATGLVIAAYTLVDGVGVRRAGDPLGYASWLFLLQGSFTVAASWLSYGRGFPAAAWRWTRLGVLGGLLAMVAYAIVLWAQSLVPLALVSALRETSLLYAGVIGALVFGERFSPVRAAATATAVVGIVLLQLG